MTTSSNILILSLFLFFLSSCNTKQAIHPKVKSQDTAVLIKQVNAHIKGLNDRQIDVLEEIYHPDFSSINPKLSINSKTALLESLQKNLAANKTLVKGDILKVEMEQTIAFVHLRWRIFNPLQESNDWEITFDQNLLEIWKLKPKGIWQLYRVLFYQKE